MKVDLGHLIGDGLIILLTYAVGRVFDQLFPEAGVVVWAAVAIAAGLGIFVNHKRGAIRLWYLQSGRTQAWMARVWRWQTAVVVVPLAFLAGHYAAVPRAPSVSDEIGFKLPTDEDEARDVIQQAHIEQLYLMVRAARAELNRRGAAEEVLRPGDEELMETLLATSGMRSRALDPRDRSGLRFEYLAYGGPADFIYYALNDDPTGLVHFELKLDVPPDCLAQLTPVTEGARSIQPLQALRDQIRVAVVSTGAVAEVLTPGQDVWLVLQKRVSIDQDLPDAWMRTQSDDLYRAKTVADSLKLNRCSEVTSNAR